MPLVNEKPRAVIAELVRAVRPFDDQEERDRNAILEWVASDAPLFRTLPPAIPPKHLAVYFALLDDATREVMLVDHIKAGCWLLPGGHVDDGEDPRVTVVREAKEELGIAIQFHPRLGGRQPFFLTVTQTRGPHSHTDVTMWFIGAADRGMAIEPDPSEFHGVGWFWLDESTSWNPAAFDPQMHRFVAKLNSAVADEHLSTATSER